ncbi:MAG: glycosyltransferase family 4 protein [Lachnospiraceae bacterium]|nr:glycosyltransferase family 4 protein [Lachnospiraceae bacterium]
MHIVFVTHTYWPHLDGVQMVNQYMAEGLVNAGYRVTVLTSKLEGYNQYEMHNGVEIYRFIHKPILKFNFGESKKFKKFLLDNRTTIDILIVVAAQSFAGDWTMQVSSKLSCKKIMYMHGMKSEYVDIYKMKSICHFIRECMLSLWSCFYFKHYWNKVMDFDAAVHLFEKDSSYNYFKKHGFEKNIVIKNGCNSELFGEIKNNKENDLVRRKYDIRDKYFLYVANYSKNKNQKMALKAYYMAEIEGIAMVFVGCDKNGYFNELKNMNHVLAESDNEKHCVKIFCGISREDTLFMIKNAYAIVMSSDSEYLPISILEGLTARKPYISTNVGLISRLPGGVIIHNEKELVYWMEYFANHPNYVNKLGDLGKEYADKELHIDDKIEQLKEIIVHCMK